jgi:hypothetical protein
MEVTVYSVLLLVKPTHGLHQIVFARILGDVEVGLIPVVIFSSLDESRLEFLFVNLARLHPHFNKHLDYALDVHLFDALAISFTLDF